MKNHTIHVDVSKCIGCGLCRRDCPEHNILISDKKAVIRTQDCIKCGHCVAVCPKAAVSMTGYFEPPMEFDRQTRLKPEQLDSALKSRRSIRRFKDQAIPPEVIEQIIEAGRFAPTAKNLQDVSYIVLKDEKQTYEKMAVRLFRKLIPFAGLIAPSARRVPIDDDFFFKKAPAAIMILSDTAINGTLAASNMALMAESNGLGVLYSGFFTMAANHSIKLRKALGLKRGNVITTLVLGYPAVSYHRTAQRDAASVKYL